MKKVENIIEPLTCSYILNMFRHILMLNCMLFFKRRDYLKKSKEKLTNIIVVGRSYEVDAPWAISIGVS